MKESLSFGGGTYRSREIILVVVAVVAVALCVLFLGLYATKPSSSDSDSNQSKTAAQHGMTPQPNPICETPSCLETTAYVWSLVNKSADPCEDFYTYACGYWPSRNPLQPNQYTNNVIRKIRKDNELRIRRLLESPKLRDVPWGSERKVKDLYKSCLDEYGRMKSRGNPFIEKVLKVVGGWYVIGNFNPTTWDLLANIEKVHVDFGTNVLFTIRVETDRTLPSRRIISVSASHFISMYFFKVLLNLYYLFQSHLLPLSYGSVSQKCHSCVFFKFIHVILILRHTISVWKCTWSNSYMIIVIRETFFFKFQLGSVQTGMYRWYYTATYSYANKVGLSIETCMYMQL